MVGLHVWSSFSVIAMVVGCPSSILYKYWPDDSDSEA